MTAQKNTLETILVVEDEPVVRDVVRVILERAGFRVLTAGSGAEAIQVESTIKETIHLLLSDVMMPDLSGPAVATILKKFRPEMRVMLMSCYPDGDMSSLNHGWHFIEKPFLPSALVERVTEVLHTFERGQGNYSYDPLDKPQAPRPEGKRNQLAPANFMRIRLISSDGFLYKVCREVLLGFRNRVWDFGMVASYEEARGSDLFLWDLPAETQFPEGSDFGSEHCIYLLARRQLKLLQHRPKLAGLSLVLKPVNRVLLRALLEQALSQYQSRSAEGRAVEQMRLECDEMLQHLRQANLKLQEYDQDRTNFLAHSVHDLRTPLSAVHGYCSLLLDKQLGPLNPEQTKVLDRMERSLRRLSRLTAGMFQISAGPLAPRGPARRVGDIQSCITQAVHEITPLLESKNIDLDIDLNLDVSPPVDKLPIDEMHIEQVLVNLLDNACRFTPQKGRIEIRAYPAFWDRRNTRMKEAREFPDCRRSASCEPNAYRIEVRDSGPGIPPGDVERIFDEYITASPNDEWSGLGLAICHQIVAAHQGTVFAESGGQGATLVFMLPSARETRNLNRPQVSGEIIRAAACN